MVDLHRKSDETNVICGGNSGGRPSYERKDEQPPTQQGLIAIQASPSGRVMDGRKIFRLKAFRKTSSSMLSNISAVNVGNAEAEEEKAEEAEEAAAAVWSNDPPPEDV